MPRATGQIDVQKNEAILNATASVLSERGVGAPIETIAKVAGVSKQTIYNHYGGKAGLIRAMISRRHAIMAAHLDAGRGADDLQATLANFAEAVLSPILINPARSIMRVLAMSAEEEAALVAQVYEAGPQTVQRHLTAFLERMAKTGALVIDDYPQAAQFFIGMVVGHHQLRQVLRLPLNLDMESLRILVNAAAYRFIRAYAPAPRMATTYR